MVFERKDVGMALAIFVCGYLFIDFVAMTPLAAGVTVFSVIICGATMAYFIAKGIKLGWKSYVWLGVLLILSVSFIIFAAHGLKGLALLLLMGLYIYWVAVATGRTMDDQLSAYFLGDCLNQGVIIPFSNFPCGVKALLNPFAEKKKSKNVMMALLGVVIILPVAVVVLNLLLSADAAFSAMVEKVWDFIAITSLWEFVWKFMLAIPVFLYLFGLIYGNVQGKKSGLLTKASLDQGAKQVSFAPKATVYTALGVLNLIYLVFFASQLSYFFSAFEGILPGDFTYAEYARQGFFQLCMVAAINFAMMTAAVIFSKKNKGQIMPKGLRAGIGVLCGFSILLSATAIGKMILYINSYGLTQLRVYTTCFMAALVIAFLIIGVRQIKQFNSSRMLIILAVVVILGVSYGNIDGVIAKYNIERYEAGTLEELDYKGLCNLSDAAVPYIYDYYKSTHDKKAKKIIKEELLAWNAEDEAYHWPMEPRRDDLKTFTWQDYKADQIRLELLKEK